MSTDSLQTPGTQIFIQAQIILTNVLSNISGDLYRKEIEGQNIMTEEDLIQVMVLEYGKVWYDDKGVANIFPLTNLVNKYRLTYNSYKYDDFTAHANIGITKFRRNRQGVYAFKPKCTTENSNVFIVVEKNMVGFKIRQIERAKLARKIYSNVGLPDLKKFKHMLFTKMISSCPI